MAEIRGEFKDLEFTDQELNFLNYAINNYTTQYKNSKEPVTERVKAFYEAIDSLNEERINKAVEKPSCKKGCAHCCHIRVGSMEAEVELILDHMKENNMTFTDEEMQRLKDQSTIYDDLEYMLSPHRRCVFLGQDNTCKIYDVRPSACRNYYVYNPPEDCNTYSTQHISGKTLVDFDLNTLAPILALMQVSPMNNLSTNLLKLIQKP